MTTTRIKWPSRTWDFTFPVGIFPEIIERYRGTPARIEDLVRTCPVEIVTRRDGDTWSIQENIGHLLDLEPLTVRRLAEYEAGAAELSPADMNNKKTHEARHNEKPLARLLREFRDERTAIVERLEALPPDRLARSAKHPRLNVAMRLVDFIFFQAEHDDYHLTRMRELARMFDNR